MFVGIVSERLVDHEERITALENAVKLLQTFKAPSSNTPGMDADRSAEVIAAINDIAENIRKESDKKYAPIDALQNQSNGKEHDGLYRRVQNLEKSVGEINTDLDEKAQLIDHNRKIGVKHGKEIDELKKRALGGGGDGKESNAMSLPKLEAMAGNVTAENLPEAMGHVINYIKKLDVHVHEKLDRDNFMDDFDQLKASHEALKKKVDEMGGKGNDARVSDADIKRWNDNCQKTKELEDLIKALQKELAGIDGVKIKADIQQLFTQQNNFVTKDSLDKVIEDVRKAHQHIDDLKYEIQALKDALMNLDKKVEHGQKKTDDELRMVGVKLDSLDSQIQALKKMLQKLNEQHKEMLKAAASGGNPMAQAFAKELEDQIARLRADHEAHKTDTGKKFKVQQAEIDTKASKVELEELEARLMDKLQELMNNLANMFADKDQMRKKFLSLEKNVSTPKRVFLNAVFLILLLF